MVQLCAVLLSAAGQDTSLFASGSALPKLVTQVLTSRPASCAGVQPLQLVLLVSILLLTVETLVPLDVKLIALPRDAQKLRLAYMAAARLLACMAAIERKEAVLALLIPLMSKLLVPSTPSDTIKIETKASIIEKPAT